MNKKFPKNEVNFKNNLKIFSKCIEYLEITEDGSFKKFKPNNSDIDAKLLEEIKGYWQKKCLLLKRPLLRKNWKVILQEDKYGKYDKLKKAFNKREKYINTRKSC